MSGYTLDASVVVKWFLPEPGAEAAQRLRNADLVCLSPDLLLLETGNALWKQVLRGKLELSIAKEAVEALAVAPISLWRTRSLSADAFALATETGRSVYDCTYLALAIRADCPLVTADRRFYEAMQESTLAQHMLWIEDVA